MRFLSSALSIALLASPALAHMGINLPSGTGGVIRDQVTKGDAYRYPNAGTCNGDNTPSGPKASLTAGQTYAFPMSSGAAHDGGHCAIFVSDGPYTGSNKLYKIDDEVDCTKTGTHTVKVPTNLPASCANGCTFVWFWTPRSSGTCEIYSNCIDVKISGTTSGGITSGVFINPNPSCSRPGSNGLTTNYGPIIMKNGNGGGGGGDNNNNQTNPPPPTNPPKNKEVDCTATKSKCQVEGCKYNVALNQCYGDPFNPTVTCKCNDNSLPFGTIDGGKVYKDGSSNTPKPPTPTNRPTNSQTTTRVPDTKLPPDVKSPCRAVAPYTYPGMNEWCNMNCLAQNAFCPPTHCSCAKAFADPYTSGQQTYKPDTTASDYVAPYNPECQTYIALGTETLASIGAKYDFLTQGQSYDLLLLQTNYDKDNGITSINSIPKEGTVIYIPGDCNLNVKPLNTDVTDTNTTPVGGAGFVNVPNMLMAAAASLATAAFTLFM